MSGNAVHLQLKLRPVDETVHIRTDVLERMLKSDKPEESIMALLKNLPEASKGIHDKKQLEMIAYWAPQGGISAKEDAKWIGLKLRIERLDDSKEGAFTLNRVQADLIWNRYINSEFKPASTIQWIQFIEEFRKAGGYHAPDVNDEMYEDLDAQLEASLPNEAV